MNKKRWYFIFIFILGAFIVHLIEILLIPHFAPYRILKQFRQHETPFTFFKLSAKTSVVKTKDPLFDLLACYFDVKFFPVTITADGDVAFWSITFFNSKAIQIFSANHKMGSKKIFFVVGSPTQIGSLRHKAEFSEASPVVLKDENGFALLRVAHFDPTWDLSVNKFIRSAKCVPLK